MTQESMYAIKYACPRCGSTDLRAEAPVTMALDEDGFLEFVEGCGPGNVNELVPDSYNEVFVLCSDCEDEGKLPEFEVTEAKKAG